MQFTKRELKTLPDAVLRRWGVYEHIMLKNNKSSHEKQQIQRWYFIEIMAKCFRPNCFFLIRYCQFGILTHLYGISRLLANWNWRVTSVIGVRSKRSMSTAHENILLHSSTFNYIITMDIFDARTYLDSLKQLQLEITTYY